MSLNKEDIAYLPTLLDIIRHFFNGEREIEQRHGNSIFRGLFPSCAQKGLFEPLRMKDGTHILLPLSPTQHSYYRGENTYHEQCYPSLYRRGMTEADIFIERIKRCEMELMMREYPITGLFANSIQAKAPDGRWYPIKLRVGFDGLAQHYGIKTEFLDMTISPLTAAFFASTTYDDNKDTYHPITNTDKYKYGIFYLYNETPIPSTKKHRIDVVGMQPLSRPGRQSAFVCRMNQGDNFNNIAQKIKFRHDATINRQIFQLANANNFLFPEEPLRDKIRTEIVKNHEFSQEAFNMAKNRYYTKEDEKILNEYIFEQRIKISTNKKQWFIESEKKLAEEYWEEYQRELFLKIQMRWTYNGPMEFTD